MTLRETTIAKLQQLPEPLLRVVDRFLDLLLDRHATPQPDRDYAAAWETWLEEIDLPIVPERKLEESDREPQEIHDLATPYGCFGAAEILMKALHEHDAAFKIRSKSP